MTTKTISVKSPQRNYDFYITVKVGDYDANLKGVPCTADLYIRNNGARFSSGGWTVSITADEEEHKDTDVSLNSTGVAMSGGQYNIKTISFIVSPSKTSFNVSAYISKSSYTTYDPGYCHLSGSIKMPQIQSLWAVGVLAVENVEGKFNLPINKFVDNYTNKVTISNLANDFIVKTIEDVENGQEVQFTQDELEKIYILDNNENSKILNFYLNLYTYSEDGTEIGIVQRLLANASLSNANPTLQFDVVEENAKVIELFGGNQNDSIVQNVSSLKFTITAEAFKGALVDSVKVNDNKVTPDDHNNYVIQLDKVQTDLFKIAVTDTRGYTANAEVKKTLLPYEPIKIKSFEFKRVSQISSEILLTADIICTSKSYNGINNIPEVYFKVGKDGSYIEIPNGFTFENNAIKFDKYKLSQELEYNQEANVYLLIKDLFTTAEDSKVVGRGVHTFEAGKEDFQVNGHLVVADTQRQNKVDVLEYIKDAIKNIIDIEEMGENGNGAYIKFKNGYAMAFKNISGKVNITEAWGNGYTTGSNATVNLGSFPIEFTEIISHDVTVAREGYNCWLGACQSTNLKHAGYVSLLRFTSASNVAYHLHTVTYGKWKAVE